jgi:lipoprotein-anchoring transpeptidase ErfK/SrfK
MAPRSRTRRTRRVAALVTLVVLAALAAVATELQVAAAQSESGFSAAKSSLDADLQAARDRGFTDQQLQPVEAKEASVSTVGDPIWVSDRPGYYDQRAAVLVRLRTQLAQLEVSALAQQRQAATQLLQQAASQLATATGLGADPADVAHLHAQLAAAEDAMAIAKQPKDLTPVQAQADSVLQKARQLASAQEADLQGIEAAAATLQAQENSDPAKIAKDARTAIAAGRNDAAVAAYLKLTAVARPYNQLEHYNTLLQAAGADPAKLALAAAGAQHYQQAIHQALLSNLPPKVVIVSHLAQQLWAYQDGKLVQDTLVTTGEPALPTDMGPMKVLAKNSPWTMRSPWPRSSPYWYPDTVVQMAIWFTDTGEALHDAYWEYPSQFGPGGEYGGSASHGCIHVPLVAEKFLYSWSTIGMPVIVYPGDGTTVANQVAQITVDANGNPTTGPKGV